MASPASAFDREMGRLNDVLCAINLLTWDARTQMPAGAAQMRGSQIATLTGLAREIATGHTLRDAIAAELDTLDDRQLDDRPEVALRRRALLDTEAAIRITGRIPEALLTEAAVLKTTAQQVWADARRHNDFARFLPALERTVAIQRQIAAAIGYEVHPYDALIRQYEPGMSLAALQKLFGHLKAGLLPLIDTALGRPQPRLDILERVFPVAMQKRFALDIAQLFGYDLQRGRLDETVHPFEVSFTREDVRITGRFRDSWLPGGLFAIWHEAGHGIYEQGIDPAFTRSAFATDIINLYAVGGASFGTHESQSRLFENRVGRSHRFWELHYGALQRSFPESLADVDMETFWRAVNAVRPSLIRVEADELTYDFHVILRVEIEAALIAGEIAARDLPAIWGEKMKGYLGLAVPDDTRGVLQDVHWSSGMIGSFPTYTIGNVMSAQFFAAACKEPEVARGLDAGDYLPLTRWLNQHVHRHGRSKTPDEILHLATGSGLDPKQYMENLGEKVALLA
ncbi:MAG TPA: carboxypeptidase M32 [Dongiaceae bacterium]|nr:carboxypeptidase M32 [Dongiaceae bacterium]